MRPAVGYWTYYLGWILLMYALRSPWLLLGIVAFLLMRRFIPDPGVLWRTWGRIRSLSSQIEANPANAAARRDLARIFIQRKRPGRALRLLDQALARHPDDAELLFLKGIAHHRKGEHEPALAPLVRAVEIDSRVAFGEPYLVAGDALYALGRLEEAEDAYLRFVDCNGSSVEGQLKLGWCLHRAGRREEASRAVDEALDTWAKLPRYARRGQIGWWLRSLVAKATIQRKPGAIGIGLAMAALAVLVGWQAGRAVRQDLGQRHGILPSSFGIRFLVPPAPSPARFVRIDPASADPTGSVEYPALQEAAQSGQALAVGDFVCRIWARYGAADTGSSSSPSYTFRDSATGTVFTSAIHDGAPSYRFSGDGANARATADAFDALLEETRPVDCAVTVEIDGIPLRFGVQHGRPIVVREAR